MVFIVLPAFNESLALPNLLRDIAEVDWPPGRDCTVVVVDDGSTDSTVECCRPFESRIPLEVISHEINRGLGAALLTGLKHCLSRCEGGDVVITLDADNTHAPSHMPAMLSAIERGNDVVIASRYAKGGEEIGLSGTRKMLSRGASLLLRTAFPIPGAADYTCGYRAYSGAILQRAFDRYADSIIEERGFVCMAELLIKLGSIGARVAEVPLVLRYDKKEGASKMKFARTIRRYISLIASGRARFRYGGT